MGKTLYLLSLFVLFCTIACKNENPHTDKSEGIITEKDLRTCPGLCCGGYFIEIEGTTYLADGLPFDSLDITTATFPLPVYLSWGIVIDNLSCPTERILVCQIEAQ